MKLRVSTNWDDNLIDALSGTDTEEVYGKLPADVIGGVRPAFLLPQINPDEAAAHVRHVHEKGINFNYLINTMCLNNVHYSREGHRQIIELLEWIGSIGIEIVTVGFPYMAHLVREVLPGIKIKASSVCRINSVYRAKQYEDLGIEHQQGL
jgi:collagenase-like PrtC family protease